MTAAMPTAPWAPPAVATELATLDVRADDDVSRLRKAVSRFADELGFGRLDQTRLVTASSELGRNMVRYAAGGEVRLERVDESTSTLLRIVFDDAGPGIADLDLAMSDGFSTDRGLGLGLGGARRLVEEFSIESSPTIGTKVSIGRRVRHNPGVG